MSILCRERHPAVLLLDHHLLTNVMTILGFKQTTPGLKVVIMLTDEDGISLVNLKKQGADGVILKSDLPEQWLEAVTAVAQNQWWSSMRLVQTLLNTPPSQPGNDFCTRELMILQLVAAGKKDKEIAQHLHLSERAVRYHLERLRTRLGVQSRAELAVAASRLQLPAP
ncbi:MAG: response regulator transcription factor [Chloroflexi bacterium]|nr:response regulator transcription factor [Ardenticatenaceae bacterium]NOG37498.1 response regulator transcription factor [Chloroflexota bacterium]